MSRSSPLSLRTMSPRVCARPTRWPRSPPSRAPMATPSTSALPLPSTVREHASLLFYTLVPPPPAAEDEKFYQIQLSLSEDYC